ncbi:MAG: SCO family protein [Planctomycetes bacterium]|nr:SCO family protein [Planctomycetota bacterium]
MTRRLLTALVAATFGSLASAQGAGMPPTSSLETREEAASMVDRIGVQVDPSLTFTDERGYPFQLQQVFPGQMPVVLLLGYYSCPAMCGQVLEAAFDALSEVDLQPGTDYRILNVSIDPKETPAIARDRKLKFLPKLAKTGGDDAWRVLVGDAENIRQLTETVGFHYYWSDVTNQFAHPPALIFLTPQGKVSRVIVNTWFDAGDVRLALVEASEGTLGSFWDQVRLNCLTFDPRTNSYSLTAMTLMRIGGAITVVVLAAMIGIMLRRERRRTSHPTASDQPTPASPRAASSNSGAIA